jgi:hypothetical protein
MQDARYFVQTVEKREGDVFAGRCLGVTATLAEAFTVVGEAIEKDQGSDGHNLLYVIRDEQDASRSPWMIVERLG